MFEMMVLAKLMCRPCHGYELKTYLANFNPNNNKIYPALRQLNSKGFVVAEIQIQNGRPNRKIYSITPAGLERFVQLLKNFDFEKAQNTDEFNLRISFSYLLDKETMCNILALRQKALLSQSSVPDLIPEDENKEMIDRLRSLHSRIRTLEMEFVESLIVSYQ